MKRAFRPRVRPRPWAVLCLAAASHWNPASGAGLFGVYDADEGYSMARVIAMESWQGKKNSVQNLFVTWQRLHFGINVMDDLFNIQLPNIWSNGNVPHITWEPFTYYQSGAYGAPSDIEVRIADGEYDGYIHEMANRLKVWLSGPDGVFGTGDDRRAYIRLGHEMTGFWYPWGVTDGDNHPSDFVCMWTRVHGIFTEKGLGPSHVQWVWNPYHLDAEDCGEPTGFPAESFYPGTGYVDWIGIDGYNWGTSQPWSTWETPSQVFSSMLTRLRTLDNTRPISLPEFASSSSGGNKGNWITTAYNYIISQDIRMALWFNWDQEGQTDWSIYGYGIDYSEYATAVGNPWFLPSDPSNPRLLTDEQFAGNL